MSDNSEKPTKESLQVFYNRVLEKIFKIFNDEKATVTEALFIGKFIANEASKMLLEEHAKQGKPIDLNSIMAGNSSEKIKSSLPYNEIGRGHGWIGPDSDFEEN